MKMVLTVTHPDLMSITIGPAETEAELEDAFLRIKGYCAAEFAFHKKQAEDAKARGRG